MIRFLPSDLKDILPRIFNENWNNGENQRFLNGNNGGTNIDSIISRLRKYYSNDNKFGAFRAWSDNKIRK